MNTTTARPGSEKDSFAECDNATLLLQIGTMNVMAISGLRVHRRETGVTLPVADGWAVTVDLQHNDEYTVRRTLTRGDGRTKIVREWEGVYAGQVGEIAYKASCYEN
jgi:hypothetical protein